jgi:hypothetical protein
MDIQQLVDAVMPQLKGIGATDVRFVDDGKIVGLFCCWRDSEYELTFAYDGNAEKRSVALDMVERGVRDFVERRSPADPRQGSLL